MSISSETVRNLYLLAIAIFTCATAFINLRTKKTVEATKVVADKTHTIVNSQKTAMMEELKSSRLITLGMASALLRLDPKNEELKKAVAGAQALYEKSVVDAGIKELEPRGE